MSGVSFTFFTALAGLMGLGALTLAARTSDFALSFGGITVFVLSVIFCFFMIKKWFDAADDAA
jgi:hypothetical protein